MAVEAEPVFVTVIGWLAVVPPTASLLKERVVGESVTVVRPVPDRVTICGELDALSVTAILPVRFPVAVGVNAGVIVQVVPAAKVDGATGHVFDWPKLALAAIEMVVDTLPVFFTVMVEPVVVVSTAAGEKDMFDGVAVTVVA